MKTKMKNEHKVWIRSCNVSSTCNWTGQTHFKQYCSLSFQFTFL